MSTLERPTSPPPSLGAMGRDFGGIYFGNAVVAFVFAATGPVAIILTVFAKGGLSESQVATFLFGAFGLNGLITILFSVVYRQPLTIFWTIPGLVLIGPALDHLTFPEVMGAYYGTGLLLLLLGLSDLVRRGTAAVPMPIVMAMVAGVFLQFGLDLVIAFRDAFWIAAPMTATFLALSAAPRLALRAPPLIGALAVGLAVIAVAGGFNLAGGLPPAFQLPSLSAPAFSWQAMVELVIPLAITVLVIQNAQGFAILRTNGHAPPVNAITVACGVGTLITAPFGAVPACFTGPISAILSGSGERHRQYISGILVGLFAVLFGLFAPVLTRLMLATPPSFIAVVAGLAMLRVLESAFVVSFRGRFSLGALVAFLVTVTDISIASIGAPFWGLVLGLAVSWLLERDDFKG